MLFQIVPIMLILVLKTNYWSLRHSLEHLTKGAQGGNNNHQVLLFADINHWWLISNCWLALKKYRNRQELNT